MNWISIKDEMPKENAPVLLSDGSDVWVASWMAIGKNTYWSCHGFSGYDMEPSFNYPTHWANLPEPPSFLTKRAADGSRAAEKVDTSVMSEQSDYMSGK